MKVIEEKNLSRKKSYLVMKVMIVERSDDCGDVFLHKRLFFKGKLPQGGAIAEEKQRTNQTGR